MTDHDRPDQKLHKFEMMRDQEQPNLKSQEVPSMRDQSRPHQNLPEFEKVKDQGQAYKELYQLDQEWDWLNRQKNGKLVFRHTGVNSLSRHSFLIMRRIR